MSKEQQTFVKCEAARNTIVYTSLLIGRLSATSCRLHQHPRRPAWRCLRSAAHNIHDRPQTLHKPQPTRTPRQTQQISVPQGCDGDTDRIWRAAKRLGRCQPSRSSRRTAPGPERRDGRPQRPGTASVAGWWCGGSQSGPRRLTGHCIARGGPPLPRSGRIRTA